MESKIEQLVIKASELQNISEGSLLELKREFAKENALDFFTNDRLTKVYHKLVDDGRIKPNRNLQSLFRLKNTRSLSGIVVVSVLTKPYPCPGKCIYCPAQAGMPKSYLKNEPAVMRALTWAYDPYQQVKARLRALHETGHVIDKVSVRIIGGTWSFYNKRYQTWFIKRLFQAANEFEGKGERGKGKKCLEDVQSNNETARCRIVELSVETRQDYINLAEIKRLRMLGVTKVELGVQSIYNDVLKLNKRGHDVESTIRATQLLKDTGFKVSYQMMLNLYGSNFDRDVIMFNTLFNNPRFQPDHIKIYPLALVKESGMYKIYKDGLFKPYNLEELTNLLVKVKQEVPKYCRIERVIRDIPSADIVEGGAKSSNLRQVVQEKLHKEGLSCKCIRCREVRSQYLTSDGAKICRIDYEASNGREIFLSMESNDETKLYSLLRLRIPSQNAPIFPVLKNSAIIREIHTYGPTVALGKSDELAVQHQGFGSRLVKEAERISKNEFGLTNIAVISGVGVREFFRNRNYVLNDTYMTKLITKH